MIKPITSGRIVPIHGAGRWCAPWLAALALMLAGCQPITPEGAVVATAPVVEDATMSEAVAATPAVEASTPITAATVDPSTGSGELQAAAPITSEAGITAAAALTAESAAATTGVTQVAPTTPITAGAEISRTLDVTPTSNPAILEAGLGVYRASYCGVCHTLTAAGTAGTFGPAHDGFGETAAVRIADSGYTGQATTPAGYIYESLLHPDNFYTPGYGASMHRMPPFTHLSQADLDALAAFLLAQ
jgi:hypothetical protein